MLDDGVYMEPLNAVWVELGDGVWVKPELSRFTFIHSEVEGV